MKRILTKIGSSKIILAVLFGKNDSFMLFESNLGHGNWESL